MNYEDDELERMRARREGRSSRASQAGYSSRGSSASGTSRRRVSSTVENSQRKGEAGSSSVRSGYSGPKSAGSGKKSSGRRGSHYRKSARHRKHMIIAAEIVVIILMILGGAFWYMYHRTFGSMQKIDFNEDQVKNVNLSQEQIDDMKGYMTVACFGVDSRSEHGQMNVGKGTNADVNMIANINLETGEIRLVSVFRDSYLNINDKNSYNKINAAYAQGGPEQAVKALNKNLGLNITQYATFNWKAVADAINILGGVDVELSKAEFYYINSYITETVESTGVGSHHLKKAGPNHLDGVQAVAYARLRKMDTDYARTERQRKVIELSFDKLKKADFAVVNNVMEVVFPQILTSITLNDMIPMAKNLTKYHIAATAGFPEARSDGILGKKGACSHSTDNWRAM